MHFKNIIFDLGGILLNIDYHATINAFKKLGVTQFETFFTQAKQNHLFDRLDKGDVTPDEFRGQLRELSNLDLTDEQIDDAWNAMLFDFPKEKIHLLEHTRKNYRTFLLSNTNAIHYPAYIHDLHKAHGYKGLGELFEQQYLSFEIGMRKPDVEIFEHVLRENGLKASETLFFDDTRQHVEGAKKAGLYAYWVDLEKEDVSEFFKGGKLREYFLQKLQSR